MAVPVLKLEGITKAYPGVIALEDVSFEVLPGEVHGLIGKNGAGKSTLVGIMAGLIEPTAGTINIGGQAFTSLSRGRAREAGVTIVTQEPELILDLSVAENLFLGAPIASHGLVNMKAMGKKAGELLSRYDLGIAPGQMAGDLPLSERQLVLILKACVLEPADVVILDEASAPLTPRDAVVLRGFVDSLRGAGKAIVYISHHVDELLEVCDRMTVLYDGKAIATKRRSEVTRAGLSELIVGEGTVIENGRPCEPAQASEDASVLLRLENFTKWDAFTDINLSVKRGEIIGLAGLRGSGRTELMKAIAGIDPPDRGTMAFNGRERIFAAPAEALAAGLAYLPEERELEGLIKNFSIRENLTLNSLPSSWGVIRKGELEAEAADVFRAVQCKAFSMDQNVDELSGGNKQKVLIGRIMALKPNLYLLDEPTKGVDIGAKKSILSIIEKIVRSGAAVLMSSPGLDDLIDVCGRICVLYKGKLTKEYRRGEFDEKTLFMDIQGIEQRIPA